MSKPAVLGPFEVEVTALADAAKSRELSQAFEIWQKMIPESDVVAGITTAEMIALAKGLDEAHEPLAASLEFSRICNALERAEEDSQMNPADLAALREASLKEVALLAKKKLPGPLASAIEITRCRLIYKLGREQEAIEKAKRLDTPDAQVLLYDMTHRVKTK
jgi:hypothetical protein